MELTLLAADPANPHRVRIPCPFAGSLRTVSSQLSLDSSDDLRSEGSSSFVAGAGAGGFGADWAAAEAPSIDLNQLQDAFPALPASSTP